jgi:hypothetical protein
VRFLPINDSFIAAISAAAGLDPGFEPSVKAGRAASRAYAKSVASIAKAYRTKPLPARSGWDIGDAMFKLRDQLHEIELEVDDLYAHLERDAHVPRKRLEKFAVVRRYIKSRSLIDRALNWSHFEHGTKVRALAMAEHEQD